MRHPAAAAAGGSSGQSPAQQGDHDDLLRRHSDYYDLCTSQFTEAPEER